MSSNPPCPQTVTSFMKSSPLIPPTSAENTKITSTSSYDRRVQFPEDESLNSAIYTGDEVWRIDPNTSNETIIDAYIAACVQIRQKPLSVVIEQLSTTSVPLAKCGIPALLLKGVQLSGKDLEALEQVFKYCQTYHISFENTNLNDASLSYLLDSLDYFAPCRELCFARNTSLTNQGIKSISSFISKYPFLNWLDLRGIPLVYADALALGLGLRGQYNTARATLTKYIAQCGGETAEPDHDPLKEILHDDFGLQITHYLPKCPTSMERKTVADAIQRLPLLCIRGLHLGKTGISGSALSEVAASARIAGHLTDFRLPSNGLGPTDIDALVPMIRYYPALQVLDLSNNEIGDEGMKQLCSGISRPSYPVSSFSECPAQMPSTAPLYCNLRRLYLRAVGLSPQGARHLALCLSSLTYLTHLDLSTNPTLSCQGILALRTALQSFTRRRLVYLGMASCGIACQGAIALAEVLADTPRALRRLDLTGNYIAEAGLLAISRSLPFCPQLVQLIGLEENRSPPEQSGSGMTSDAGTTSTAANSSSPMLGGITRKLAAFRISRQSQEVEDGAPSPEVMRECHQQTSARSNPPPMWLDLLRCIHAQLAANLDARVNSASYSSNSKKKATGPSKSHDCSSEIRFFRGYARFSTHGHPDPRHLPGDTSDSDLEDSFLGASANDS